MAQKVECCAEGCTRMILTDTAERTGGYCMPWVKKQKKPGLLDRLAASFGVVAYGTYLLYDVIGIAIVVTAFFGVSQYIYGKWRLPERLEREGIQTEAVFWQIESTAHRYGKKGHYR